MTVRMTPLRRSLFAAGLLALAAGSALAAKDVVLAISGQPETLDPYNTNTTLTTAVTKSFYQGLYEFDKDLKVRPVLAESHTVSKDGLVYTFKLRAGVKFHDGTDFNAEAVKTTLDRVLDPDNKLARFNQFNRVDKVEVAGPLSVRITLKEPFGPFINSLAHASAAMISPAALRKYGNKDIAFNPVGTGPFTFVEWKQTDFVKGKKAVLLVEEGQPLGHPGLLDAGPALVEATEGDERVVAEALSEVLHAAGQVARGSQVRAQEPGGDQPRGCIETDRCFRFGHRHAARFKKRRHDADAIAAGHGMGAIGLQDDEAGIDIRPRRFEQEVHGHGDARARLGCHEAAEAVIDGIDMVHLLQGGLSGNFRRTADDDLAKLSLTMNLQDAD